MKRVLTIILSLVLMLCMTTSAMALVLRPNDTGADVVTLQKALQAQGYSLAADGKYGPATTAAVMDFQQKHGLKVDGKAGPNTLGALGIAGGAAATGTVLKVGAVGADVLKLQQALASYNYPVGTIDGKYGTKTYRAVVLFQQLNGLKADGKAGPLTQAKLYGGSVVPYAGATAAPIVPGTLTKLTLSTTAPCVGATVVAYPVPSTATAAFAWYREDGTLIGTGSSYVVTKSDLHTRIYCVATGTGATTGTVSSLSTSMITLSAEDAAKKYLAGTVSIPTEVAVDAIITPNVYLNPATDLYYTWYVGGAMTASTKTLHITADMVGKDVRLVVKAQDETILGTLSSNYCTVRKQTSDSVVGGTGDGETNVIKTLFGYVTLPKEAQVGDTLTPTLSSKADAVDGKLSAPADKLVYSWYKNGQFIGSSAALKVKEDMIGSDIHLVVSAAANSGYMGSIGSNYCNVKASVQGTKTLVNGKVEIPVRASVGVTVGVTNETLNCGIANVTYKWTINGVTVGTAATILLTEDMAGENLYLTVTAKDDSTYWGSVTSAKCFVTIPE